MLRRSVTVSTTASASASRTASQRTTVTHSRTRGTLVRPQWFRRGPARECTWDVVVFVVVGVVLLLARGFLWIVGGGVRNGMPPFGERVVCVVGSEPSVIRAWKERGWTVMEVRDVMECIGPSKSQSQQRQRRRTNASVIWSTHRPPDEFWNAAQSWQRLNWIPFQHMVSQKASLVEGLQQSFFPPEWDNPNNNNNNNKKPNNKPKNKKHKKQVVRRDTKHTAVPFVPESYVLPTDLTALLERLVGVDDDKGGGGGLSEPWVVKHSVVDEGRGIGILGPHSEGLTLLVTALQELEDDMDADAWYTERILNEPLILPLPPSLPSPLLPPAAVTANQNLLTDETTGTQRSLSRPRPPSIVVQRYVCQELDYRGKKFDLRVYVLVASVEPLVVLYHDGYLRVSNTDYRYDRLNFTSTRDHLTNLAQQERETEKRETKERDWEPHQGVSEANTVSMATWGEHLRNHSKHSPPWNIYNVDPLDHVRNQMMSALASTVYTFRDLAFQGYPTPAQSTTQQSQSQSTTQSANAHKFFVGTMENGFALWGADFIVDRRLKVWMTEVQSAPGLGHETTTKRQLHDTLLPSMVDVVEQVMLRSHNHQSQNQNNHNQNHNNQNHREQVPLWPLDRTGDFRLVYTDDFQFRYDYNPPVSSHPQGSCGE